MPKNRRLTAAFADLEIDLQVHNRSNNWSQWGMAKSNRTYDPYLMTKDVSTYICWVLLVHARNSAVICLKILRSSVGV